MSVSSHFLADTKDEQPRSSIRRQQALAVVLDCHRLLRNVDEPPKFPSAGQRLGEFRLLRELGRGGQGRVFLATQPSLSDRPLVVKLTAPTGQEHLSLARLQHTNI